MREHLRCDGAIVLSGDGDDSDQVMVEGVVTGFAPVRGNLHCACGAELRPWHWRSSSADTVELVCRCNRTLACITIGVRVHR
jgi:hypothetical protein